MMKSNRIGVWVLATLVAASVRCVPAADDSVDDGDASAVRMTADLLEPNEIGPLTQDLSAPARIALTSTEVLVADPQANAVVRFDRSSGVYVGTVLIPDGPVGLAAHSDGRVFISLRDGAQVGIYDASFNFIAFLGEGGVSFVSPTDMALNETAGRLYVVDSGADRVYAFDHITGALQAEGEWADGLGGRGTADGQFKSPGAIAVDATNNRLLVADQDNYRIQIFDGAGQFLDKFGYMLKYVASGTEGWMPRTVGLAVDPSGHIYVVDGLMSTVRIFDSAGAELGLVLEYGSDPGDLRTPGGLALDPGADLVFLANSGAHQVEVYNAQSHEGLRLIVGTMFRGTNGSGAQELLARVMSASVVGWDPPHMEEDTTCGRCHGVNDIPAGPENRAEGQANLCFSCHSSAGQAFADMMRPAETLGTSHAWNVPAISAEYGSVGPEEGGVMSFRLDGTNIKCSTCHDQHSNEAGAPFLRAAADTMCMECHAGHVVHTPEGDWQPTCTECHGAHDPHNSNLSLVNATVYNLTLGQDMPVQFLARSGANSFDDGDPAVNDGICQVCHTQTIYHTHDGSGEYHHDGAVCTDCHKHDAGFMASSCTGCHASAQDNGDGVPLGGRRAVVGEFPVGSAHAHYGAQLDDTACQVCHSIDTHMNGYVELIDPDSGALYTFQTPSDLPNDPDLSDFCMSCHDSDGALRLSNPLDPFGNGNAAPDVASRFSGTLQWEQWYGDFCFGEEGTLRMVNSHHDISDADQALSGAKLECLSCHGAHTSAAEQPTANPFDTTAPWLGESNDFCLQCHYGGAGPADPGFPPDVVAPSIALRGIDSCDYTEEPWWTEYSWTHSAHGLDSKRGWDGYSGAPSAVVDCVACHDPHGSYTPTNTLGNPYMIRDFVDGTSYVDDGTRTGGWNGPPWETFGTARDVQVTISGIEVDWGGADSLCVVCHSDWLAAYDWHSFCNGCQTCHGHGMAFGEADFVGFDDDTPCPIPLRGSQEPPLGEGETWRAHDSGEIKIMDEMGPPEQ